MVAPSAIVAEENAVIIEISQSFTTNIRSCCLNYKISCLDTHLFYTTIICPGLEYFSQVWHTIIFIILLLHHFIADYICLTANKMKSLDQLKRGFLQKLQELNH